MSWWKTGPPFFFQYYEKVLVKNNASGGEKNIWIRKLSFDWRETFFFFLPFQIFRLFWIFWIVFIFYLINILQIKNICFCEKKKHMNTKNVNILHWINVQFSWKEVQSALTHEDSTLTSTSHNESNMHCSSSLLKLFRWIYVRYQSKRSLQNCYFFY
jgi:hypothetical protein